MTYGRGYGSEWNIITNQNKMIKITEITFSKSQTIQVAQFEPTNVYYSIKAEVGNTRDIDGAYKMLEKIVEGNVNRKIMQIEAFKKAKGKSLVIPEPAQDEEITIEDIKP